MREGRRRRGGGGGARGGLGKGSGIPFDDAQRAAGIMVMVKLAKLMMIKRIFDCSNQCYTCDKCNDSGHADSKCLNDI